MATIEERLSKLEKYVKDQRSWKDQFKEEHQKRKNLEGKVTKLERDNEELKNHLAKADEIVEKLSHLEKDAELVQQIKLALRQLLLTPSSQEPINTVGILAVDKRINQRISEAKEIQVVKVDVDERLEKMVKDAVVQSIVSKVKDLPSPAKKAAPWLYQRKESNVGELNEFVYEKTGRPSGSFYTYVVNPLKEAGLITINQGELTWVLKETLKRSLIGVSDEELDSLHQYILSFLIGDAS